MKKTFLETLVVAENNEINAHELMVAVEVEHTLSQLGEYINLPSKQKRDVFEHCCSVVWQTYLKLDDFSILDVCTALKKAIETHTLHQVMGFDVSILKTYLWEVC